MTKILLAAAALVASLATGSAFAQADARAVPTYEAVGLYWTNPGAGAITAGCDVKFRKVGTSAWTPGFAMWYDARDNECRGSLVSLTPGTAYEAQMSVGVLPATRTVTFTTWTNVKPVLRTITVPSGSGTYNITQGGSPAGYVVYQGAPGAVLDANNAVSYNVTVNASYVIIRGLTLKGAQRDAIRITPTMTDVVIEDNDISGWGRLRSGTWGVDLDSGIHAVCSTPTMQRVVVQRNQIHHPRYGANSWSDGHPAGPQAITFSFCGGNHVIRHNEIYSTDGRYFNDAIGGEDNNSLTGFPNNDSDIYGNEISHAWDDAIEAEGGNKNVRIWGNYMDRTGTGIASTMNSVGPSYFFRNVYNRSRILEKVSPDQDDRQVMFKAGSDATLGDGRRYIFHNTTLQPRDASSAYGLGAAGGISGTGSTSRTNQTVSRNNIFHNWRSWTAYYETGVLNDFGWDMHNGSAGAPATNNIVATPTYAPGNGWQNEAGGLYALQAGTPGYDQGTRIPNFNDAYVGAAPDIGAAEAGAGPMKFGVDASPGPSVPVSGGASSQYDFNRDGKPDLVWCNTANGNTYLWYMNGPALISDAFVTGIDLSWRVQGIADFNGDGKPDLVWRNNTTGNTYVWYMDGPTLVSDAFLFALPPEWVIQGVADFNRDGKPDFLMRNVNTGVAFVWFFNNATAIGDQFLLGIDPAWKIEAVGDMTGDGQPDLLFRNTSSGLAFEWSTTWNGSALALGSSSAPLFTIDPAWEIAQMADWNGDGQNDLLFRNRNTGVVFVWYMTGMTLTTSAYVTQVAPSWEIVPRR